MDDDDDSSLGRSDSEDLYLSDPTPGRSFSLVIAFADTTTRNRAMALYDRLAQGLLRDCEFQCRWYQVKDFENPGVCQRSAELTGGADMVIVSLRAASDLPSGLKQWLDAWLSRREAEHTALVSLITTVEPDSVAISPVQLALETMAKDAGVNFFVHYFGEGTQADSSIVGERPSKVATRRSIRFEDEQLPRPPRSGWGLNE